MSNKKKSLQKFTDSQVKFEAIFSLEKITYKDLEVLSKEENDQFYTFLNEKSKGLKGVEREKFWNKIDAITSQTIKNQLWEFNHNQIIWAITDFIQETGRMPVTTEIAERTHLSRQTVHKHLKEYSGHPLHQEHLEHFRFMTSKVLARVFQMAIKGDMQAAKLYLNAMGVFNTPPTNKGISVMAEFGSNQNNTLIQKQNNYIQINNTVLNQEIIKQLKPDQLEQIEAIIQSCGLNAV